MVIVQKNSAKFIHLGGCRVSVGVRIRLLNFGVGGGGEKNAGFKVVSMKGGSNKNNNSLI